MAVINISNQYNDPYNIKSDLLYGCSLLSYIYHSLSNQTKRTANTYEQYEYWHLSYPRYIGPFPIIFRSGDLTNIDAYDLSYLDDDKHTVYYAGIFIADTDTIDLPIVDFNNNSTVLNDLLVSSFYASMCGDPSMAYVYLQTAYQLMSIYGSVYMEREQSKQTRPTLVPYTL